LCFNGDRAFFWRGDRDEFWWAMVWRSRGGEKPGLWTKSRRRCLSYLRNPVS